MIITSEKHLNSDWVLTGTPPDEYASPDEIKSDSINWLTATVPGTVAQAYQDAGLWSLSNPTNFDDQDWWYKTSFTIEDTTSSTLVFSGLASLCDVWLNGKLILSSSNMFVEHQLDVHALLQENNELVLCFRSINNNLKIRRERPRWKTKLVSQQQLRWIRTSLVGRIPGWTPPIAPNGPWQPIYFLKNNEPINVNLKPSVNGDLGYLEFTCQIMTHEKVKAQLIIDSVTKPLEITAGEDKVTISGIVEINNVKLWWPHTHGQPYLYTPELSISIGSQSTNHLLSPVGFKTVSLDQSNDNFKISLNKKDIFCRGACWTVNDIVSLCGSQESLENTLTLMRDAGANMIRIGGTMLYEQTLFYQLCDKLGIMVWQDFMFANMDYPIDNDDFLNNVKVEVAQILNRLRKHSCISIYCGNSEIDQQISMLGLSTETLNNRLFSEVIPEHCARIHSEIPYITSTPIGGTLPFQTNKNLCHYYGIGAYQRPMSELRNHDVKFTSECLGFANIPITETRNEVLDDQLPVTHHPKWKERVPRDTGTGWDFEDVRDHYTESLFSVKTTTLKSFDTENYLALSELTTGEIMSQVFSEWRSTNSQCMGGLVWFLKDLWPGAGWGLVDSNGYPKACYYYLKRCWQSINLSITNESLNGIDIHINNESITELSGDLELMLLNNESTVIAHEKMSIHLDAAANKTFNSDQILSNFNDITYSYRFGPAKHSIVAAVLKTKTGEVIDNAFYFPNSEVPVTNQKSLLKVSSVQMDDDVYQVNLSCNCFLYGVNIDANGYTSTDNFFHLLPNSEKIVYLKRSNNNNKRFKGYVSAINLSEEVKIKLLQ